MTEKRFEVDIYTLPTIIQDNNTKKTYSSMRSVVDLLNNLAEENERLRNHKKVLDEDNTDKYFQIRKQEQQIKKLQEINEELSEKIKELSFNDYKRCLEIINHQRTIINKIEKLTGQTIEELIINLDKGVEME